MNIVDAVILVIFMIGILSGVKKGAIKSVVSLVGFIIVIVLAYSLKNMVANIFYSTLPFFQFKLFKGVFVFNIIFYEILAFLIVAGILLILLVGIIKITGIIEKLFDKTIILGLGSRILGAIICFVESYIIVFIILFILNQPFINISYIKSSKLNNQILATPLLSNIVKENLDAANELLTLKDLYKNSSNIDEYNYDSLDILLKYNIITVESVKTLQSKDKLNIKNLNKLIEKYGG